MQPDTTIGHYRIIRQLGKGGMGEVYLAEDTNLKREVAIKVLPERLRNNQDRLHRFRREAEAAAKLKHNNIATIYALEDFDDELLIVMEYVEGEPLTSHIPAGGMALETFFKIFIPLADALAHAHSYGRIHRDLKPANIMIAADGTAKILDFGLARIVDPVQLYSGSDADSEVFDETPTLDEADQWQAPEVVAKGVPSLTRDGQLLGTPQYMSPEQAERKQIDARTDIFSFGVVMYEALTGQRPFDGESLESTIGQIVSVEPTAVTEFKPATPSALWAVMRRCLVKDRERRMQSALELHYEMQEVQRQVEASTIPTPLQPLAKPVTLWRKPLGIAAMVVSIVLVSVMTTWFVTPEPAEPPLRNLSESSQASIAEEARQEARSEALVDSFGDRSIAVLPFINMSDDASNEYFSDGISEELLNLLAGIPELRVISRSSAFSYKGKEIKVTEVARELNVAYVLEGSVRKAGNQVRITVQLIEARSDTHLWSKTFDRTLDNIFAIQDEIASAVVEHLKITLLGDSPTVRETDPAAYAFYLQGQFFRNLRSEENLERAVTAFKLALAIDPDYAPAWAGIARIYLIQTRFRVWSREQGFALAKEALERALAIDNNMVNALATFAYMKWTYQWDSKGAKAAIDRGFRLEPNNLDVRGVAAFLAKSFGQYQKAIELLQPVIKLDPLDLAHKRVLGLIFTRLDRFDEAIEMFSQVLTLNPGDLLGRKFIGIAYLMKGDAERALTEFEKLPVGAEKTFGLAHVYFTLGNETLAQAMKDEFIETYAQEYSVYMASIYAWRGENDAAFEWLERAYQKHSFDLSYFLGDPPFKDLASDPRYPIFLEKLGLLEAWRAMPPEYGGPVK